MRRNPWQLWWVHTAGSSAAAKVKSERRAKPQVFFQNPTNDLKERESTYEGGGRIDASQSAVLETTKLVALLW